MAAVLRQVALLLFAVALAPGIARADTDEPPIRAALAWSAPEECGLAAEVAARVSEQLGHPAFVERDPELWVRVTIEHGDHFVASVDLATATGEAVGQRVVESRSPTCGAITESVVVVLGVMLNIDRAELDLPPPAPRVEAALFAAGGVELGLLPGVAGEATLGFSLGLRGVLDVALEAGWIATPAVPVAAGSWLVQAGGARLVANVVVVPGDVELSVRLGVGAGAAWASVSGLDVDRSVAAAWLVEVRGGLRLLFHATGVLWISLVADGAVLPLRPDFRVRDADGTTLAGFTSSIGVGSVEIGPLVRFE